MIQKLWGEGKQGRTERNDVTVRAKAMKATERTAKILEQATMSDDRKRARHCRSKSGYFFEVHQATFRSTKTSLFYTGDECYATFWSMVQKTMSVLKYISEVTT